MCKIEIPVPCNGKWVDADMEGKISASSNIPFFLKQPTNLSISIGVAYLLQRKCHWKCHDDISVVMEECRIAVARFIKKLLIERSDHVSDKVCLSLSVLPAF